MPPDWRVADHYICLAQAERKALAWEWLRRTTAYGLRWIDFSHRRCGDIEARHFGLERFEDPSLATPDARPLWCSHVDPSVITGEVSDFHSPSYDQIDLYEWEPFVSIAIDPRHEEHILLSDGMRALRIDIVRGTLVGCPARLSYRMSGLQSTKGQRLTLDNLVALKKTGRLENLTVKAIAPRWILELRVADALQAGASQHDIALNLFGSLISRERWREESAPYRLRVQRLVRSARRRLRYPFDKAWFT